MVGFDFEFKGIRVTGDGEVYRPGEDSFLLLDWVTSYSNPGMDLDIDVGTGSGIIGIENAYFNRRYTILIDVSMKALEYAFKNSVLNGVDAYVETILWNEDLSIFRPDLSLYVMSNPPYLPVSKESIWWTGGRDGLDIIFNLIESLVSHDTFRLIFVFSSLSDLTGLIERVGRFNNVFIGIIDWMEFPMEKIYLGLVCR